MSAIDDKYAQVIKTDPWIGKPTEGGTCPDGIGKYQHYAGGASIYWSPSTGAHLIYGLIRAKYSALGWEQGPSGYPVSDEADAGSGKGRYNGFQNGVIIWKRDTAEAFAVYGAIFGKWAEQKYDSGFLGFPTLDETGTPDGVGRYNHFEGGSIYWTGSTGAHMIYGLIRDKWAALGWEQGPSGYPVTDEAEAGSGKGRYNAFQNGVIIWKRDTPEAFAVYGAIFDKWAEQKYDSGFLGFPTLDETGTPDGVGRYNHFEGGSIYWTAETGAHFVRGAIRNAWSAQEWEQSRLQYPVTDELMTPGTNNLGRYSDFEGGQILWTPQGGTTINYYPTISDLKQASKSLETDKLTASQVQVTFWNDGKWRFHVYLDDSSTWYGDAFAIGFVIAGDGHGATMSGTIGAGDAEPREISGTDPWIEKNFHKVRYNSQLHFRMKVKGDLGGLVNSLVGDLVEYAPLFIALL
ncbi:MAG: hypothetical protein ACM3JD_12040 [Rudaea sp.]